MADNIGKQAISPLVATILLLAFSIAIGAVVMSWGESYVEEKANFVQGIREVLTSCEAASFTVIKLGGSQQICYKDNSLELSIDNGQDIDIHDFNTRILGTTGIYTKESTINAPLKKLNAVKLAVLIPNNIGTVQQVKITPKIQVADDIIFCKDQSLVLEGIQKCQ